MKDEIEPLYEVKTSNDGPLTCYKDGLSREEAEKLASELFEMGYRGVSVQEYFLD